MAISTKRTRLLPPWVLRLVGISSLATAIIGFAIYWFKKFPPRRRIDNTSDVQRRSSSSTEQHQQTVGANSTWGNTLLNNLKSKVRKNRRKMTISLKNTILWNPSPDVAKPIYGFKENNLQLLTGLSYLYDIHIIVHVNSEEERNNIDSLLKANLKRGNFDKRKLLYCSEEEGKIHIVRHIEPFVHIEGGWEMDDGEDIVKKLKPFVHKIVWLLPKNKQNTVKDIQNGPHVEISDSLIDTSVAQEVIQQQ